MNGDFLARAFLAQLPPSSRDKAATAALAGDLDEVLERARREAPSVKLDAEQFAAYLADRVAFDAEGHAVLASLHAGALWIAYGCVIGDHAAMSAFESTYAPEIAKSLARSFDSALAQDAELRVRERLFLVEPEERARIASYSGRGDLRLWLRAATVRTATDLARARRAVPVAPDALAEVGDAIDPMLGALKQGYRDEFRMAFAAACAALTDRDRTLLRYRFVDGLSIDEIAPLYRVHRSTAARWLSAVRDALFEGTREGLMARLELSELEVDGVLHLIDSQLDASVSRVLGLS